MEASIPIEPARAASGVRTVHLSDGVTAYDVHGADASRGAWVVLVHGLATPMYAWRPLATALERAGFRVLRYDHFGRGLSDRPDVRYDLALYVRQLRELMAALAIDAAHVVGWSMGGIISSRLALERPSSVERHVLIAPGLFLKKPRPLRVLGWLPRRVAERLIASRVADRVIERMPREHFAHPERVAGYLEPMREQLRYAGTKTSLASTLLCFPWRTGEAFREVGRHDRPVLLVWGDRDSVTPYRNAPRVQGLFPRARLVTIAGAKHAPHVEHAERVNDEISAFLAEA